MHITQEQRNFSDCESAESLEFDLLERRKKAIHQELKNLDRQLKPLLKKQKELSTELLQCCNKQGQIRLYGVVKFD